MACALGEQWRSYLSSFLPSPLSCIAPYCLLDWANQIRQPHNCDLLNVTKTFTDKLSCLFQILNSNLQLSENYSYSTHQSRTRILPTASLYLMPLLDAKMHAYTMASPGSRLIEPDYGMHCLPLTPSPQSASHDCSKCK